MFLTQDIQIILFFYTSFNNTFDFNWGIFRGFLRALINQFALALFGVQVRMAD